MRFKSRLGVRPDRGSRHAVHVSPRHCEQGHPAGLWGTKGYPHLRKGCVYVLKKLLGFRNRFEIDGLLVMQT